MEERAYKRREDAPEIGEITRLSAEETKNYSQHYQTNIVLFILVVFARVNGRLLRNALISCEKHGATLIKGDAILVREGNHITGVTVNDETILAEKVIVTAGAWANEILNPLGINFLVTFQKDKLFICKSRIQQQKICQLLCHRTINIF